MKGPPLGPGGEDITWPNQVAFRGRRKSRDRNLKPPTSNLGPQCRSIKCTTCKIRAAMTGLAQFDAICLFECTNGRVFTTGNEQSAENCLRIKLEETIECASTLGFP